MTQPRRKPADIAARSRRSIDRADLTAIAREEIERVLVRYRKDLGRKIEAEDTAEAIVKRAWGARQ